MRRFSFPFVCIVVLTVLVTGAAVALTSYTNSFNTEYGTTGTRGGSNLGSCITCHNGADGTGGFNPYGSDFGGSFTAIENIDSDGDGFTNIEEILAGTFPGNDSSMPQPSNTAPTADAGPDQTVFVGDTVTLDGSGSSDVDGDALTFNWSLTPPAGSSAVLSDSTAVSPTFVADVFGTYVVQLIVNDGTEVSTPSTVTIDTDNSAPVAGAGQDQNVVVGDTVTLDGSGSSDVDGDALLFSWSLAPPAGSSAVLSGSTTVNPSFVVDVAGTYDIQLIVNDGSADSTPDAVSVTAADIAPPANTAPVADAGQNQPLLVGETVYLDGSNSSDVNGDPLNFIWSFGIRPAGSNAILSDPLSATPTFVADVAGDYTVQLIVNDGSVDSVPATVLVTASPVGSPANTTPVADAGQDQNVPAGALIILDGTGSSDADGNAITFSWTFASVPVGSTATLSNPTSANPTFVADMAGSYMIQLIVYDGTASSTPDAVVITASAVVQSPPGDEPPDEKRDGDDEGVERDNNDDNDRLEKNNNGDHRRRYDRKHRDYRKRNYNRDRDDD